MTVIKRGKQESTRDLLDALNRFIELLESQEEDEAAQALRKAGKLLSARTDQQATPKEALKLINEAFGEAHELSSYIIAKPSAAEWTEADQLSQAATRVLNLSRRLSV